MKINKNHRTKTMTISITIIKEAIIKKEIDKKMKSRKGIGEETRITDKCDKKIETNKGYKQRNEGHKREEMNIKRNYKRGR